jgi:16S rRNA (uracil1498-N3)-methyltransferase
MPRFFVSEDRIDEIERKVSIVGDDAIHIARSLRMAVGESLTVCDGEGMEYECVLEYIRDSESVCRIITKEQSKAEPPYEIRVYQALVKGERFDTVIQKSVEFGATSIIPFESSRCVVRLRGEREEGKSRRRRRIATEAAKQCGRGVIPCVADPVSFDRMLGEAKECSLALFCYEKEQATLLGALLRERAGSMPQSISIVVGPEGGFSEEEAERAREAGILPIGLGRRILRTESAAAFVLASLSAFFELN